MNRKWTPTSRVSMTEAGLVIEIELGEVPLATLAIALDDGQLCIRGEHEEWGSFECRFEIVAGHNTAEATSIVADGVLRIEVPRITAATALQAAMLPALSKDALLTFPRPMLIYCKECGKHFDIILTSKEPAEHQCPACGAVQRFALGTFVDKAIEHSKKMLRKIRGRR